jgi:predicted transcriptional regulator
MSIQPKWCSLIKDKKKTAELRRNKPVLNVPLKCYIYETKAEGGTGSVIGEFVCCGIVPLGTEDDNIVVEKACLTEDEIAEYKPKFAWLISDPYFYSEPKTLDDFNLCMPPQSWCYVNEL